MKSEVAAKPAVPVTPAVCKKSIVPVERGVPAACARVPKRWWMGSLRDHELLRQADEHDARDRECTADLLARLAEIDRRRLYRGAGFASMFTYCVRARGYSQHAAYTRIRAARLARRWPQIFDAVADGRLHLSALATLAPVLTAANAAELLRAAERATKRELQSLLAERFPRADVPTCVHALVPLVSGIAGASGALAPEPVGTLAGPARFAIPAKPAGECLPGAATSPATELVPERVEFSGKLVTFEQAEALARRAALTPLAPQRVALQVTIATSTHAKLQRAQELLGHAEATTELAEVLDRALDALIERLEKRRCAIVAKPRAATPPTHANPRHIPAAVRRAVRVLDGERCTYEANGRRCEARHGLHMDHIRAVADGGESTPANLRLLCGPHNQLMAERRFGEAFMQGKREQRRANGNGADASSG